MNKNRLKYLLPIRSIMFILIFVIGAWITSDSLNNISNWWSIVATIVNIVTIIILINYKEKEIVDGEVVKEEKQTVKVDKNKNISLVVVD